MLSNKMKELLDKVYETTKYNGSGSGRYRHRTLKKLFISDNLRRSYQPARAEGLVFRLIETFVQKT